MATNETSDWGAANLISFDAAPELAPIAEIELPPTSVYSSRELRGRLAGMRLQLSRTRKIVATIPLLLAGLAWFIIPSYAHGAPVAKAPSSVTVSTPTTATSSTGTTESSGGVSVTTPADSAVIPVTGAGSGLMRSSAVGLALMMGGLIIITAPRRNPHAEAVWYETNRQGASV